MVNLTCEICGGSFSVRNYRAKSARFCSQRCGGAWHARERLSKRDTSYMLGNKWAAGHGANVGSFKVGARPWNKGRKVSLSPKTQFKPGRAPVIPLLPVGSVSIHNTHGERRAFLKIAQPNVWRLRARVVWEATHGKIPRGRVIHHRDHDKLNDAPENLECLTRAEHVRAHRSAPNMGS